MVTNAGNGYDAASGQFRVPVSGSYMFVVNFMGEIHTYNYVHMMLDGDLVDTRLDLFTYSIPSNPLLWGIEDREIKVPDTESTELSKVLVKNMDFLKIYVRV